MHNRIKVTVSLVTGALLGATVMTGSVANAGDPRPPVEVHEQNVDADGNIKVHEQGTVAVQEQREPFQFSLRGGNWGGVADRSFSDSVPDGKMFVAQTIGFTVFVELGQDVRAIATFQGVGSATKIPVLLEYQGSFAGRDFYVGTEDITAYAAGTTAVRGTLSRSSAAGNAGELTFNASGYLIDKP